MEALQQKYSLESIRSEAAQIKQQYIDLSLGQYLRKAALSCHFKCGGAEYYPFILDAHSFNGPQQVCFGNCYNVMLEHGPKLRQFGDIPEGRIPKKFIWSHNLNPKAGGSKGGDDGDGDEDDDEDDD